MKNKSKLKKIKEKTTQKENLPSLWLFLAKEEVSARTLKESLEDKADVELEIWEGAGIVEVILSDGKSVDFEQREVDLGDDYSNAFLEQQQTKALFYVTIHPDSGSLATAVMEHVLKKIPGLFCGDTDDFTPMIGGKGER